MKLDPRLQSDSVYLCDLELCQVRLQDDSRYPWIVLVPRVDNMTEVHDLSNDLQIKLIRESSRVAEALARVTDCKKVNVANLGNVVSQLHWHVVARFEGDETWPGPIWGFGKSVPYTDKKRADFVDSFLAELSAN